MSTSKLNRVRNLTKDTNTVLYRAGEDIAKNSFSTARKLAKLYKDAGMKSFQLSKKVVKKTIQLSFDNQKEILKTSGSAIKEIIKNIRADSKDPGEKNKRIKKNGKPSTRIKSKKEVTIDDLISD